MKKLLLLSMVLIAQASVWAQTFTEWHDMNVNGVNRMQNHTSFFAYENSSLAIQGEKEQVGTFPLAAWRLAVQVGGECLTAAH